VVKPHGNDGSVQVASLTDFPDRYSPGSKVEVGGRYLTVASQQLSGDTLVVKFVEIDDRDGADKLRGAYCTVPLRQARPLPDGRFYAFQLVGLTVIDQRAGKTLGTVAEVLAYSANDVLLVTDGNREVLIPMVRSVISSIEPSKGQILVEMPDEAGV
jgi:16S rRNA processing protein RimM